MVIIFEVGNSTIQVSKIIDNEVSSSFKVNTILENDGTYYETLLNENINEFDNVEGICICSVVTPITEKLDSACQKVLNIKPYIIDKDSDLGIENKLDVPEELGADLAADVVGAVKLVGYPVICIDLGTANKIVYVNNKNEFLGGMIFAGIGLSYRCLISNAFLLRANELSLPENPLGRNTKDCINSGVLYGALHSVLGLVNDIEKQYDYPITKVVTGGNAIIFKEYFKDFVYEKDLTVKGAYEIYKRNQK